MESYPIRRIIEDVLAGQIRIPAFQRDFVWDPERVVLFVDSLYKGYPYGSLLFWRANELLVHERQLGPYALPELREGYPIDYVLDGQQRLTSIFTCFQTVLPPPNESDRADIYFDYQRPVDPQDSNFFALPIDQADSARFFPVAALFDTIAYREATRGLDAEVVEKIDRLQSQLKETMVPVELLRTNDRAKVAIVFERINHQGVPLDTLQLLTAWTWSDDFDLQERFEELREVLEEHGFAGVGEDTSLVLRCCAAILTREPTVDSLIGVNGAEVRGRFGEVENGIKGAIDFLKHQLGVESLRNLPYPAMLIPLSVYFATAGTAHLVIPGTDTQRLTQWFWRSAFSERYSGQTNRVARGDIAEMENLRRRQPCSLGEFPVSIEPEFFLSNQFRIGTAADGNLCSLVGVCTPKELCVWK